MIFFYRDTDNSKQGDIFCVTISGDIVKARRFDKSIIVNVGDYVKQDSKLYKCKEVTIVGAEFDESKFDLIQMGYMSRCKIRPNMGASQLKINGYTVLQWWNEYEITKTDVREIEIMNDIIGKIEIMGES